MSARKALAKEIHLLEEEIKELEIKRSRSQASLIESLISKSEISAEEAQYFRNYTAEIDIKRERLQQLTSQLEKIV